MWKKVKQQTLRVFSARSAFPADFVVQQELVNENRRYDALYTEQMPFYLCKSHESI